MEWQLLWVTWNPRRASPPLSSATSRTLDVQTCILTLANTKIRTYCIIPILYYIIQMQIKIPGHNIATKKTGKHQFTVVLMALLRGFLQCLYHLVPMTYAVLALLE